MTTNPRQICDAYFRALAGKDGDGMVEFCGLQSIPLPPAPVEEWFWKRVAEEFDKWEPEEKESIMPITTQGKEAAVNALKERRNSKPEQIDNSSLYAGSSMTFYCVSCGHVSDVVPEGYISPPAKLCGECKAMKDLGWLE